MDENGILYVTAEDKRNGNTENLTITSDKFNLTDQEMQKLIEKANDSERRRQEL